MFEGNIQVNFAKFTKEVQGKKVCVIDRACSTASSYIKAEFCFKQTKLDESITNRTMITREYSKKNWNRGIEPYCQCKLGQ